MVITLKEVFVNCIVASPGGTGSQEIRALELYRLLQSQRREVLNCFLNFF